MLVYGRWGDCTHVVECWSTADGATVLMLLSVGLRQMCDCTHVLMLFRLVGVGDAAADVGHKAHVLLVQHGDGDVAALGKVEEPAGGGHHHVTALGPPREQGVRIRQGSPVCNRFSLC